MAKSVLINNIKIMRVKIYLDFYTHFLLAIEFAANTAKLILMKTESN